MHISRSTVTKLAAVAALAFSATACATPFPYGALYTEGSLPIAAADGAGDKEGRACMESILGLVATGDSSVETAKQNGGITRVTSVDYEVENVLGVIGKYCTVVRGS